MRFISSALLTLSLLVGAEIALSEPATPSSQSPPLVQVMRNTPQQVLNGEAKLIAHFDPAQKLRLVLGIQPPHLQEEQEFLEELQDRNSPQFHHFLTPEQWNARFGPSVEAEQAVVDWAEAQGLTVTNRYPHRLSVVVETDVATIEKALGVTMNQYQIGSLSFFSNDREPVVPQTLSGILQSVTGLNSLQTMRPAITGFQGGEPTPVYAPVLPVSVGSALKLEGHAPAAANASPDFIAPAQPSSLSPNDIYASTGYDFQALYHQGHCCNPLNHAGSSPLESTIAILGVGSYASSDVSGFGSLYGLAMNVQPIAVGGTPSCCSAETTLEVEWAAATSNSFGSSANTSQIFVYEAANSQFSTFLAGISQISSDNKGRIFLTGLGCAENYCYSSASISTANAIFNTMAGAGWTLIAPSGDNGASSDCAHTSVQYPGSDPNFVAVGGTFLQPGNGGFSTEVGWTGGTAAGSCAANNGGSGGGCSSIFSAPNYQGSNACGANRSVPDIALNAATPQNYYYNGSLTSGFSTSFAAAEIAGFFAQSNAYLLYIGSLIGQTCGGTFTYPCAPVGSGGEFLYWFGSHESAYYSHLPFYDVTTGCNSNDVTALNNLPADCATAGYDLVTGWGSTNMLQLAWAMNTYMAGDWGAPQITFSGPATNTWFNVNKTISWSIVDTSGASNYPINGVSGYSSNWDSPIADTYSEPAPGSASDSFYSGPQYPNATSGSLSLAAAGQGCHTAYVFAWDNAGYQSGNQTYGPVCYDTTPPVTTATLTGTYNGSFYSGTVQITLSATDNLSGVSSTSYQLDGGAVSPYVGAISVSSPGSHTILYHSVDVAGNVEAWRSTSFNIASSTASYGINPSSGSSSSQTFTFTFTAPNQAQDHMLFSSSVSAHNSCYIFYSLISNTLFLLDDSGNSSQSATPGASATLFNSQCSVAVNGVTVSSFNGTVSITVPITFSAAFCGSKNIYSNLVNTSNQAGAWQQVGTWTVPVTGSNTFSVSPASGSGSVQTFTFTFTAPNQAQDHILINSALSATSACYIYYYLGSNMLFLLNDSANSSQSAIPGTFATLANSQCSVAMNSVTVSQIDDTVTLTLPITLSSSFAGTKNIYSLFVNTSNQASNWQQVGTWTIPTSSNTITVNPSFGSGSTQTFTFTFPGPNQAQEHMLFNTSLSAAKSCYLYYYPSSNTLFLLNDLVNSSQSAPVGTHTTLTNSQCSVVVNGVSASVSANTVTLTVPITFSSTFSSTTNIYADIVTTSNQPGNWQQVGVWTP